MRKTLRVSILVLALCSPTLAGDMLCPPVAPPAPMMEEQEPVSGAEMGTMDGQVETVAATSFVEVVLSLLALA